MPKDIIYILKEDIDTEELKYSLRSIEQNFPHRFVWFIGGQPEGLTPDRSIKHKQSGENKWDMIRSSMVRAVQEEDLTEDFFLFNDDFFVMKPFKGEFVNYIDNTLDDRIEELRLVHKWLNPYARTLVKANEELKSLGCKRNNFEVHLPMIFKKSLVLEAIKQCSSPQMRSVYGNIVDCPVINRKDVKVYSLESVPYDPDFISTNDDTFRKGMVGQYIKGCFSTPSRFENTHTQTG